MQVGENVPIFLIPLAVGRTGKFQGITLICVFGAESTHHLEAVGSESRHTIESTDALGGFIVEGIADVAIFTRGDQDLIEVGPVGAIYLIAVGAGRAVEGVFVEERVAIFVAIHTTDFHHPCRSGTICQVEVAGEVAVGVMLPAAGGCLVGLDMVALKIYLCIVGGLVGGYRI